MWNKILKSKQGQVDPPEDYAFPTEAVAGPSSPLKSTVGRKGGLKLHREDGSLKLASPLKLQSIPKKVRSTFNLPGSGSQLNVTEKSPKDLLRRASQEVLPKPKSKALRRASFNLLTRRPSLDALRSHTPEPRPTSPLGTISRRKESSSSSNSASGTEESVRSILREPNTPGTGKSVRFFSSNERDTPLLARVQDLRPTISQSTPPEDVFLGSLRQSNAPTVGTFTAMPRLPSSRNRPTIAQIFAPMEKVRDPPASSPAHITTFIDNHDIHAFSSSTSGRQPHSDAVFTSTPHKDSAPGSPVLTTDLADEHVRSHDRSASFSFGQQVFYPEPSQSKRSSSGKSSLMSKTSDVSGTSSSLRSRSLSDSAFSSLLHTPPQSPGSKGQEPDPFSVHAKTYYTPQTMIPTTPPNGGKRHVRTASKEESMIFSLQAQLDMQTELCGQYESDLRARDESLAVLQKQLAETETEDAKKRKFLRAWKKKAMELERTCQMLEDEVDHSRQESMERSVMDEASGEALRALHRQISGLERDRDSWKRTETVLRDEIRRLEKLAGEKRTEAAMLRASLGSLSEKEELQREHANLKGMVDSLEKQLAEEKEQHDVEKLAMNDAQVELLAAFKVQLLAGQEREEKAARNLESVEAQKCALAMERDSLRLQVSKIQDKSTSSDLALRKAECRVTELQHELSTVSVGKDTVEKLNSRLREEESRSRSLEQRTQDLQHERQYALDSVSRLEATIRIRDAEAAKGSEDRRRAAMGIEQLQAQIHQMEQSSEAENTRLQLKFKELEDRNRELEQQAIDKDVLIAQMSEQHTQDLAGLNATLDSKQQELDLLKRRPSLHRPSGSIAGSGVKPMVRRDSSVQSTRISRPSSIASESGLDHSRERKPSGENASKIQPKPVPTRLASTSKPPVRGTTGPPLRPRPSVVGSTVSPTSRKVSKPAPSATELGEKENSLIPSSRRLSRIPTLAH